MESKKSKFYKCSPQLPVKNLRETLNYYHDILGFHDEWTFGEIDGGIQRGELRLIFAEDPGFVKDINNAQHRLPLMWFVENIEAVYSDIKGRNIELADELKDHPYGLREFAFIDINGYYIRVAEAVDA